MIAAVQPGCCAICRLAETGAGYAPPPRKKHPFNVVFTCDTDLGLAKVVHHMPKPILNRITSEAVAEAMNGVGAYCDRIGKTDLATLTRDEFETIGEVFLEKFGEEMRERLGAGQPPF